jgi:SulP family sulfate permease
MQRFRSVMALVASGINFVDLAGAQLLAQEARRRRTLGGGLYLYNVKAEVLDMLQRSGAHREIGAENLFALGEDAIGTIKSRLDGAVCARCSVRIFAPCKSGDVRP